MAFLSPLRSVHFPIEVTFPGGACGKELRAAQNAHRANAPQAPLPVALASLLAAHYGREHPQSQIKRVRGSGFGILAQGTLVPVRGQRADSTGLLLCPATILQT